MWRLIAILSSVLFISCSKSESAKEPTVPPQVQLKTIDGRCLDLQTVIQQMDHPSFRFPGFVYTRNFQVHAKQISPYVFSLMARSFRANSITFKGLPDFKGAMQQGCEKIETSEFGGRPVTYKITSFSATHLELEFDKSALGAALSEVSKHHKSQLTKTPMIRKYKITFISPTQLEVISEYDSIPSQCYKNKGLPLKEEVVYGWAESSSQVSQNARINRLYWKKLNQLAAIVPEPDEQRTDEDPVLNLTSTPATITALKSYAHPPCL